MQLQVDQEQKEIKTHGSYEFPMRISHEKLSYFEAGSFPWHWHPEIELTLILEGEISYQVNEKLHLLKAGDGLFCNTNVLHSGHKAGTEDCHYLSVTFHPRLVYGSSTSILQSKYVTPVLNNTALSSICFRPGTGWMEEVLKNLRRILDVFENRPDSAEIRMQLAVMDIWRCIYENVEHAGAAVKNSRDTERIRRIIEYVRLHYMENITLEQLAEQVHLCKSESCRMFKRYMNETMFDYLTRFRIERSLELLKNSDLNITQVAEHVGFGTPGYFTRMFRMRMGCTPQNYRKGLEETGGSQPASL